jgi:hypothetical protein
MAKLRSVEEIIRQRGEKVLWAEAMIRIYELRSLYDSFEGRNEFVCYFPVAAVAALERLFRLAVRELIDRGEPFINNSEKLTKDLKFTFDAIRAFQGEKISVGEFIAYHLPFSNINHINHALSSICGVDFFAKVSIAYDRWEHEVHEQPIVPIISNPEIIFQDVECIFQIRHNICHGSGLNLEDESKIGQYFNSTLVFMEAMDSFITQQLYPNAPLTQAAMNAEAAGRLDVAMQELEGINAKILSYLPANRANEFSRTDELWNCFYKAWARFKANEYEGGIIAPLIYYSEAEDLVFSRIKQLRSVLEGECLCGSSLVSTLA